MNIRYNQLTKKLLEDAFDTKGITVNDVAEKFNCNEKTIRRNLIKYGLKTRNISEIASLRQLIKDDISDDTTEIINGELLGDGNLSSRCNFSARYQHSSSKKEYIDWLSNKLKLKHSDIIKQSNNIYHFSTKSYLKLKSIYDYWYIDNKKKIPYMLKLTPVMALHWYIGDGCKSSKTIVTIGTYGFHIDDLNKLMNQLSKFNPRLYYQCKNMPSGYGYRLAMNINFLNWIGNCPKEIENIYGYK